MQNRPPKQDQPIQFESARTSTVRVQHTVRTMKFYNVAEHEMESLSLLNSLQVGFASAGALFAGIALPDAYSYAFPPTGSPREDAGRFIAFGVIALACFLACKWNRKRAVTMWNKIGSETDKTE